MPPTPVGQLDDARNRALTQRIELAFTANQLVALLDARATLLRDLHRVIHEADVIHVEWADLVALWHLGDVDRVTDLLAALHHLIGEHLGL